MTSAEVIDFASLTESFLAAQLAGDRKEALRVVVEDGLGRGARVIDLQARVIRPAQHALGRMWQENRVTIAQEHLATGISQLVMTRLFEFLPATPRNGVIVTVACVEGENHELPVRIVADYLHHAGFTVRYLGAGMSTSRLIDDLRAQMPGLLALSITMSFNARALREAVKRIREELGGTLTIIVGGHALDSLPGIASELGVETAQSSPDELMDSVRRLTGLS